MSSKKHQWTPGEKECMAKYEEYKKEHPETRKNLTKLVKHINMLNPFPDQYSWEYIFFDRLLNDEQVDFLLKIKLRHEYTIDELAKILNKDIVSSAKFINDLVNIGILEYCTEKDSSIDKVKMPVFAPGGMENTAYTAAILEHSPEIAPAFLNYILDLQKMISSFVPHGNALMRTIPVEKAIANQTKKVSTDEVSHWLDWAEKEGCIAVGYCECRRLRRMVGEGTADLEGEWCISLGKLASSLVRAGKHRKLTRQEAEEIIKKAEDKGYVHQLSNVDGKDYSCFICNCPWDTCMALRTSWYTSSPNLSSSNYRASVDPKKCVACGGCVEVCPQNAVKLGEKLCTKTHIRIKPHEVPGNHLFFGKKQWEGSAFLTDRENVYKETGTAPCKVACPAHIAVQGYLELAKQGRYEEALALIKKENPFPAVCGSVCHKYCEHVCTRGKLDAPVSIDEVKRFLALRDLNSSTRYIPEKYYTSGHKIAVIGAGPAGLSCAYYLAILGHSVTVFDKNALPGGMMRYGMPSFRLEKDLVEVEIEAVKALGAEIKCGVEVGKDVTLQQLREEGYKGFYLAIGCQGGRKLGVPGEESENVISGVSFLHAYNESGYPLNGEVIVVGGGNVAMDVARAAKRSGGKVKMYCLESREEMPASKDEIEDALSEGIEIYNGWGPMEIKQEGGKAKGIVFKKCLSVKDASGKFAPVYDEKQIQEEEASYILTAIGQSVVLGDLLKGSEVETRRGGFILADSWTYQTKQSDVFVGGDVYSGPRFAIDAIAAGKEGADSLHRYVHEGHSLTLGRVKRDNFISIDKDNLIEINDYDHTPRQYANLDKSKELTVHDPRLPFDEAMVKAEASRCLSCGRAIVDEGICIGCGLCTTRCKFDAISLHAMAKPKWGPDYEHLVGAVLKEEGARIGRTIARPFQSKKDLNK